MPSVSKPSDRKNCMPPTFITGRKTIATTTIPRPPAQCRIARHRWMPRASESSCGRTVVPVVVKPDIDSNIASVKVAMPAMHDGMMNEDADVAFACGMIAHHQGAIDMAEVLLAHGEDEQMRALAQEIIDAQEAEIEQMTTWLAENAN